MTAAYTDDAVQHLSDIIADAYLKGVRVGCFTLARMILDAGYRRTNEQSPDPVVEHALMMSGGSMQVRNNHPDVERVYPLTEWIPAQQRFGGKVYARTVIVVEDWHEVPPAADA